NTASGSYWTAATFRGNAAEAGALDFWRSGADLPAKDSEGFVRCVRRKPVEGELGNTAGRYVLVAAELAVADTRTGLTWERSPSFADETWDEAVARCDAFGWGGWTDWRWPTRTELFSIADHGRSLPAWTISVFDSETPVSRLWSSTVVSYSPSKRWNVSTAWGYTNDLLASNPEGRSSRCVR
ncbi:MAG: DUF1566 domain-containing protein, partial [Candidatus Devosia euplotis]|nr:DUF1566 domain-containing protein [Candidatus Devosia euplotis]